MKPSSMFSSKSTLLGMPLVASLFASLIAGPTLGCRGDSDGNTDTDTDTDTDSDTDDNPGDDVNIVDIQDPAGTIAVGDAVTIRGAVVLAKDSFGTRKGNIFIGEPGGGAYSGVLVFGVDTAEFDAVAVGDLVDLEGAVKTEFALSDDTSGRTTTELQAAEGGALTLTKVGTGTVPAPAAVDAAALAAMDPADADAEWEKWEGVLIAVEDTTIVGDVDQIGDDKTFLEFTIEGDVHVDNSLAEIPADAEISVGACAARIVGMGDYFFSWKVLPRATADVELGGNDCTGLQQVSVEDVQTGAVVGPMSFKDVVVTAKSFNGKSVWVADAAAAAASQGVLLFGLDPDDTEALEVGDIVDVTGSAGEYTNMGNLTAGDGSLTEIFSPTITPTGAPAVSVTPVDVSVATLLDAFDGEPYEGVLVRLIGVGVTDVVDDGGFITLELTGPGGVILAHDSIYRNSDAADGDCFDSITGIFTTNTFDDVLSFLPVSADAFVPGACG